MGFLPKMQMTHDRMFEEVEQPEAKHNVKRGRGPEQRYTFRDEFKKNKREKPAIEGELERA